MLTLAELLRSYRVAHSRAVSIEPFEKALKEHTPLAGISDPNALVEYLDQLNLKGDMVMDELKRVSTDRDEYKKSSGFIHSLALFGEFQVGKTNILDAKFEFYV